MMEALRKDGASPSSRDAFANLNAERISDQRSLAPAPVNHFTLLKDQSVIASKITIETMATSMWLEPRVLIENIDDTLLVNNATAAELEKVDKPLVVVCIAGPYRTGKSYLMNRLAGKQSGFALGSTVESKTKGIWVWLVNHPLDRNKALLLMDTEGLEDAFRSSENYDTWICCLAVLLSSMFVYNIVGKIESTTIDKLEFVSGMSTHIRAKNGPQNSDKDFDEVFPSFVLAVRDFFLVPEINGELMTADEYMEHMLLSMKNAKQSKLTKRAKERELDRQDIKMKLRSYFKRRSCFFFPLPVREDLLKNVDTLPASDLDAKFLEQADKFCDHVYRTAPVKKLDHSHEANGPVMVMLARQYVASIRRGDVPCVESAVNMVSQRENECALKKAIDYYCRSMAELLQYPVSASHLADTHSACHKQSVDIFLKKAFLDRGQEYHSKLQDCLLREYSRIINEDAFASWNKCLSILQQLFSEMEQKIQTGKYICSGGYKTYLTDLENVIVTYHFTKNKGVKSEEALLYVISQRNSEKMAIMKSDEALTEAEKKIQDESLKHEEALKNLKLQAEQKKELERHHANLAASHKEHLETLNKTFTEKLREQEEEFDRLLAQRTEEQKRLMEENFEKEAADIRSQIEELETRKRGLWKTITGSVLGLGGAALSLIPTPLTRFAGLGLTLVSSFFR